MEHPISQCRWPVALMAAFCIVGGLACAQGGDHSVDACLPDYEIYDAVIRSFVLGVDPVFPVHPPGSPPVTMVVIRDSTHLDDVSTALEPQGRSKQQAYLLSRFGQAAAPLITGLFQATSRNDIIPDCFRVNANVRLIADPEIDSLFEADDAPGWKLFWNRYPTAQGILSLSSVAFDKDSSLALVYAGNDSGADAGKGLYIILRRGEAGWTIEARVEVWVS